NDPLGSPAHHERVRGPEVEQTYGRAREVCLRAGETPRRFPARAGGSELALPWGFAMLAGALGKARRPEEALNVLDEALAVSSKTGDQSYEAEIYRLKGELSASSRAQNRTEAESCFRRAIEIARRQQAKSWELRAVTSMSRLLRRQGNFGKDREEPIHDLRGSPLSIPGGALS